MARLTTIGLFISRYGLVYILLAIGTFKFTNTEAMGIKPFIDNSPFFSWMYHFMDIRMIARVVGVTEIIAAIAIASRFLSARVALFGSVIAIGMFIVTLSFLFTTPGTFTHAEGFVVPDGFLIKDPMLLGFSVWSAGEAYDAIKAS